MLCNDVFVHCPNKCNLLKIEMSLSLSTLYLRFYDTCNLALHLRIEVNFGQSLYTLQLLTSVSEKLTGVMTLVQYLIQIYITSSLALKLRLKGYSTMKLFFELSLLISLIIILSKGQDSSKHQLKKIFKQIHIAARNLGASYISIAVLRSVCS